MTKNGFELKGDAPAIYEAQKVPAIFDPLAELTLDMVPLLETDSILDAACGTGIVARKARKRVGYNAHIVGVDLNEGMIETARNLSDPYSRSCEWHAADITKTPFEDDTFTIALCQQGFQFFPDKQAALGELKRVLKPDGRLVLTVWSELSIWFQSLLMALTENINADMAQQSLSSSALPGQSEIWPLLVDQDFSDIQFQIVTVNRTIDRSHLAIRNEILASPLAAKLIPYGEGTMEAIVHTTFVSLSAYRQGEKFIVPQRTYLVQAKA